jgi:hypothetical protein
VRCSAFERESAIGFGQKYDKVKDKVKVFRFALSGTLRFSSLPEPWVVNRFTRVDLILIFEGDGVPR